MTEKTIIERLEHEIKTDYNLCKELEYYVNNNSNFNYNGNSNYDEYSWKSLELESDFEKAIFELYCFFDYDIEELYELIKSISFKYNKSDLGGLSFSLFIDYTKEKHFKQRKEAFKRNSDEYKNKLLLKESVESDYVINLVDDYNSTEDIIDKFNSEVKCILNNEDISPDKKTFYLDKYSKITNRLTEKRDLLIKKIRAEKL